MNDDIRDRYQWFRKQGVGGWAGHDAATCLALARAEAAAKAAGLAILIEDENEGWDGDGEAPAYLLSVRLVRPCENHGNDCRHTETLASLGMVGVNDACDPYLRIVAAELALESQANA